MDGKQVPKVDPPRGPLPKKNEDNGKSPGKGERKKVGPSGKLDGQTGKDECPVGKGTVVTYRRRRRTG
jgi:hypothetical protein